MNSEITEAPTEDKENCIFNINFFDVCKVYRCLGQQLLQKTYPKVKVESYT